MKWYHWLLLVLGVGLVAFIAWRSQKRGNPDSLSKARKAKEEKRINKKLSEIEPESEEDVNKLLDDLLKKQKEEGSSDESTSI